MHTAESGEDLIAGSLFLFTRIKTSLRWSFRETIVFLLLSANQRRAESRHHRRHPELWLQLHLHAFRSSCLQTRCLSHLISFNIVFHKKPPVLQIPSSIANLSSSKHKR